MTEPSDRPTGRAALLSMLRGAGFVSGEHLAAQLGVSRAAVWKQVASLRALGYDIEARPRLGYRLSAVPDLMLPEELVVRLTTRYFGRQIEYRPVVESTNDLARRLASSGRGAPEGAIVVAEEQRSGRGRRGRGWQSPPGGIWFSIVVRPGWLLEEMPLLTMTASLAVARTIEAETGLIASIKWPNDVLVGGRKVCGVLSEAAADPDGITFAVVGIGINANVELGDFPPELRDSLTSLESAIGRKVDRAQFLAALLAEMESWYYGLPVRRSEMLDEWRARCETLGREVTISAGGQVVSGRAVEVDSRGALVLELQDGSRRAFASGDIEQAR